MMISPLKETSSDTSPVKHHIPNSLCFAELWNIVIEPSTTSATDHESNRTVVIMQISQFGMRAFSSTWFMAQPKLQSIAQDRSMKPTARHFGMILLRRMGEFQL
jgi:hypothetical protein